MPLTSPERFLIVLAHSPFGEPEHLLKGRRGRSLQGNRFMKRGLIVLASFVAVGYGGCCSNPYKAPAYYGQNVAPPAYPAGGYAPTYAAPMAQPCQPCAPAPQVMQMQAPVNCVPCCP